MSTDRFGPSTPSGDWQQYVCTTCGLPKRVSVRPSVSPMSLYRICKRCESRQRHRADGGSGKLNMIDLTTNTSDSTAAIAGGLRAGRVVRTPVRDDGSYVELVGEDSACSGCDNLISPDAFGESAPFFRILAQQKRERGETHCPDCIPTKSGGGDTA